MVVGEGAIDWQAGAVADWVSGATASFLLIGLAEIGDKSPTVCIALASRHRHWPVLLGAAAAFLLLNTLAVVFGAGVGVWLPERLTAGIVALLFGGFGVHALLARESDDVNDVDEGRALLQWVPASWLRRGAGVIFLLFAMVAGWRAFG